jgi:cytochrome c-type biogenesis protein CcmF
MGKSAVVGPYLVTLDKRFEGRGENYEYIEAQLSVSKSGGEASIVAPQRRLYDKWQRSAFSEATTIPSLGSEFYATLLGINGQNAVLRISSNPLVNWLWIGGALMSIAPLLGLRRRRKPQQDDAEGQH